MARLPAREAQQPRIPQTPFPPSAPLAYPRQLPHSLTSFSRLASARVDSQSMQQGMAYDVRDGDGSEARYKSSVSPEPTGKQPRHRRNYQACEPCRERKVKCDMGDVDNPHNGPCKKCAREKKNCYFAAQRKKPGSSRDSITDEPPSKRPRNGSSTASMQPSGLYSPGGGSGFPTSGGLGSPFPNDTFPSNSPKLSLSGPSVTPATLATPSPRSVPNQYGPAPTSFPKSNNSISKHDQIQDSTNQAKVNDEDGHLIGPQANTLGPSFTNTIEGFATLVDAASKLANATSEGLAKKVSRTLSGGPLEPPVRELSDQEVAERERAKDVWNRMRFVRAGWLTAEEAMDHVDYFFRNLAPMTPVINRNFSSPSTHGILLTEEPVLALAILSIASRHVMLQTPGTTSRNFYIHEKLWEALRCIVQRLLWGQEQFGGGFCGAGLAPIRETTTGQITWKGSLRTLGTVEALLILTDWQPRALHFPPGDDENKLIVGDFDLLDEPSGDFSGPSHGNLPYAKWLEPAWRMDRMSWMLLGLAQSLSFELGVFSNEHSGCRDDHGPDSECVRKRRIRRILITYVSQISGRMGVQSSLTPAQDFEENLPGNNEAFDQMQKLWFTLAGIMFDANATLFIPRELTNSLMNSGEYKAKIADLLPRLQQWEKEFTQAMNILEPPMRYILRMEYDYGRLYINSLGMQKVVDYWVQQVPAHVPLPERMQQIIPVVSENKRYIDEVRAASTRILRSILDLAKTNNLKTAPVRVFLRSLSGMMFTLKLFSLGNDAKTVKENMKLLRATTHEMSDHVVDDVHLAKETARLIQILMDEVSKTMIRIQKPASRDQSRQLSPQPHQQFNHGMSSDYSTTLDNESPDPLAEIPFADTQNQIFIPPPNFDLQLLQDSNLSYDTNIDPAMYNMSDDWYTMPLNNLFTGQASNVNQGFGGIGPTLGDRDMLAILTDNQYDQNQMNGLSQGYGGFNSGF